MKKLFTVLTVVLFTHLCLCVHLPGAQRLRPVSLGCEYLTNPIGIDELNPHLSWQLESSQRGQKQTAYHLLVASSSDTLDKNVGDLWDTSKWTSEKSLNICYAGKALQSRRQYFWKVRVWGVNGEASKWSETGVWGMGILNPNEWEGQWISSDLELYAYQKALKKLPDHDMEHPRDMWKRARKLKKEKTTAIDDAPAVWLRKEFTAEKKLQRATAYVSGLGFYELYLNGRKSDDSYFNTTVYDFGKTIPYLAHDVTDRVKKGNNAIGIILANGYYNPVIPCALREYTNDFIDTPRLRCELFLEYTDGTTKTIPSDTTWQYTTEGPITFNSLRAGETYDARKELGDWSAYGYDGKAWKSALSDKPPLGKTTRSQQIPPLRVIKEIPAVSLKPYEGGWRFDVGGQTSGWARLKLHGNPGQKISIQYPGVTVHTVGRYQRCEYICKGGGDEYFSQRFSFNGYQFIEVYGLDYRPKPEDLAGLQVVSDMQPVGNFSCSEPKLNHLQDVHLRTIHNYNIQMPMDPVREKSCWTQDVQSNFECSAYNHNLQTMYRKWQMDFLDQIQANGYVPPVVPSAFDGPSINGPWWGGMMIYNPWQLYNFYGDLGILARSYEAMKHHMTYYDSIAKDNIVEWGLGDWLDAAAQKTELATSNATTVPYTSTAAYFHFADIISQAANVLGKPQEAAEYKAKMAVIREALHKKFFNAETGVYDKGSQTAYILALRLKIASDKERPRTIANLKKQIARDDNHLSCGFVGLPFLLTELTEIGEGDLAWTIATQDTYPGWYDMVFNHNNTVFMEAWNAENRGNPRFVQMPSLAGSIGTYFYRSLGGIRPDEPGFKTFIVAPYTNSLDWVKCEHQSPYGMISSNWSKKEGILTMDVTVPVNTMATVYVPGKNITEGSLPVVEAEGVTFLRMDKNKAIYQVESGKYEFKSILKSN